MLDFFSVLDSDNHTDLSQRLEAAEERLQFAEKMQRTYSVENEEQTVWGDVNTHTLGWYKMIIISK